MLHTRVGAVHADLHLHNMTIFELSGQYVATVNGDEVNKPVIAYIAGPRGEADTYVFPHDGRFAGLIDFSRAILGPTARPRLVAESGEAFAAGFYRSQASRALRALHHYIPSYVATHQERIKGLIFADFGAMFRVMTAIDFLAIWRNYGALLRYLAKEKKREGDVRVLTIAPAGIEIARRIERLALEHLVVSLSELVEAAGSRSHEIPYAGDSVISGVFDEFCYSAWAGDGKEESLRPFALRAATLVDVWLRAWDTLAMMKLWRREVVSSIPDRGTIVG